MSVTPGRSDGIAADHGYIGQAGLVRRQGRTAVEPARHAGLAAAERAWAQPPERRRVVRSLVAVVPDDLEAACAAVGMDRDGGRAAHATIVPRRNAHDPQESGRGVTSPRVIAGIRGYPRRREP